MCLGYELAQLELVLMIARFAQRLDLTATSEVIPKPTGMVVNRPIGGAPSTIRPTVIILLEVVLTCWR